MTDKRVCIICPNSCEWEVDSGGNISGLKCKRGIAFARQECNQPLRIITTTIRCNLPDGHYEMVPVKSQTALPLEQMGLYMYHIRQTVLVQKPALGDVITVPIPDHNPCQLLITGE